MKKKVLVFIEDGTFTCDNRVIRRNIYSPSIVGHEIPPFGWFSPAYGIKRQSGVLSCHKRGDVKSIMFLTAICVGSSVDLGEPQEKAGCAMKNRLKILDIWVDPVTRAEAIRRVSDILKTGQRPHSVFASNPEKNFSVPRDPDLYRVFEQADLLLPDGIGIVWAARLLFGAKLERVPGSEFIEDICRLAVAEGYKVFVYGATEEVNRKSAEILQEKYPGTRGRRAG